MRLILLAALLCGCVHAMALDGNEQCALEGMKLTGASLAGAESVTTAYAGGTTVVAVDSTSGTTYQCAVPEPQERCAVDAYRQGAAQKAAYDPRARNVVIGIGYCAWILPGIVAYAIMQNGRTDIATAADRAEVQALNSCSAVSLRP